MTFKWLYIMPTNTIISSKYSHVPNVSHIFFLSSNDSIRNSRNLPSIKYDKIILWLVLISNDTASSENRKYIFEGGWQTDTVATYFDHTICLNLSLAYESLMKRSSEFGHIILCRKKTFFLFKFNNNIWFVIINFW